MYRDMFKRIIKVPTFYLQVTNLFIVMLKKKIIKSFYQLYETDIINTSVKCKKKLYKIIIYNLILRYNIQVQFIYNYITDLYTRVVIYI